MAGLGRKQWSPGDTLNAADVNGYLMDQSVMVFAGTAARASAIPTPSAGMVAYSTATSLQVYDGSDWVDLSTGYGTFTGGSSITDGGETYSLLSFNAAGSVVITEDGLFDVLIVAGGAGAAGNIGGGGGGGGVISKTVYLTAATYTVTVGSGGSGGVGSASGTSGNPSSLNVFAALGGGRSNFNAVGTDGGSGGGGWASAAGGAAQAQQGSAGGTGGATSGGGGGGNTAVGANGSLGAGGNGGAGLTTTFSGSSLVFGSGGGGGGNTGGTGGTNAGNGGANAANGTAGTANFGGGGGGGGNSAGNGANGGSGFVAIRAKV
jgi:hypothetical protein